MENVTNNMNIVIKDVADRIKALRELSGIPASELAKICGVTIDEYNELESGTKDFNFTFVYKCALTFGVDITDILKGSTPTLTEYSVVRKGKGLPIARRSGYVYQNMAPYFKDRHAEPFWVQIPFSEEDLKKEIHTNYHKGQEVSIILKGAALSKFGSKVEELHEGDVIYFDSMTPHGMVAIGGEPCEFFTVIINPEGSVDTSLTTIPAEQPTEDDGILCEGIESAAIDKFIDTKLNSKGVLKEITFNNENKFNFAFDIVDEIAKRNPDKLAMLHIDNDKTERRFSFDDMRRLSNQAANYFSSIGIKKGDRVMLVLKRHYQFWVSILALHKIGAITIPATNQLVCKDFEYRFTAAGVSAIVATADGDVANQVELAEKKAAITLKKIIVNREREGWALFDREIAWFKPEFERPTGEGESCGDDPILMFFTSGTTGYPKIASHSHKYGLGHYVTSKFWHNTDPDGLHFTISDTGWGKAMWGKFYGQWMCEAPIFTYDFDRFHAEDILPMFAKYGITTFCAPPTMYRFFIKEDLSKYDLSSIKYACTAGEALNPEVFRKFKEATGLEIKEGFGQTETTLTVANLVNMPIKLGSMGKPSPQYKVEILRPDGTACGIGETGEICINTQESTPCGLFLGYYNNPKLTEEAWHDGYYHTGDTAWRDEDGYFWYVGRVDDLIKSSGYRIGPFEIESVIMELPYVVECAVTAVPDEIRGQAVKATIVLTKGTEGTDELRKDIQDYVKKHTAPYKYPRVVEFVDELPKTISGKIRRAELRKRK